MIISVIEDACPYLVGIVLLDKQDVVLVVVVLVEVAQIVFAILQDDEDLVFVEEFAQQLSMLVVVQSFYIGVVPHLAPSEGRVSTTLQANAINRELCQQVSLRGASLDGNLREILVEDCFLDLRIGVERNLDDLCLAIGVGREIHDSRARCTLCHIVLPVANHGSHVETLHEAEALLSVTIHHIIDGTRVVLLEYVDIEHVFAHEHLFCHADHLVFTFLIEDDDIVEVGAVAHKLVLFQSCTDKAVCTIDVELLIGFSHLRGVDGVEIAYLRLARMILTIFVLEELEPIGCHLHEIG